MKTLPKKFTKSGYEYTQVARDGNIAVFRRQGVKSENPHWETVRIQSHNGYEIAGNKIEAAECYPSSSTWGVQGWTFLSLSDALQKMEELLKLKGKI